MAFTRANLLAAGVTIALAAPAFAQLPTLALNGASAEDNSTVIHAMPGDDLAVELHGTPGAYYALLMSIATNGADVNRVPAL